MPRLDYRLYLTGAAALSLALVALGLWALPRVIAALPTNYFVTKRKRPTSWRALLAYLGRNLFAACLLLAGIVMLFLPGPGLLTMFVALTLLDFPGRQRLLLTLVRRPLLARALLRLRAGAGKPPFEGV